MCLGGSIPIKSQHHVLATFKGFADLHPVSTTRINIARLVDLDTVRNTGVYIGKYSSICKSLGCFVNVERITAIRIVALSESLEKNQTNWLT